jgi:hypothetical protein
VRKKTGTGLQGVSRQEGNQTLKAERSGWAYPREVDLLALMCCRDPKAQERSRPTAVRWLGLAG